MLEPGDMAPDFEAADCDGGLLRLSDFRGRRRVVLFFFPRAFTAACTAEVRHFRQHHQRIGELGAELLGVSVDRREKNCRFARAEGLRFPLIGDESRAISQKYGVLWPVLRIDRRATFVIDEAGAVRDVFHHELKVERHLEDVLARLQALPPLLQGAPRA